MLCVSVFSDWPCALNVSFLPLLLSEQIETKAFFLKNLNNMPPCCLANNMNFKRKSHGYVSAAAFPGAGSVAFIFSVGHCSFARAALHGIAGGYKDGQDGTPGGSPVSWER